MRWAVWTHVTGPVVHFVVAPLDAEAKAETAWPVTPRTLCRTGQRSIAGPCEVCQFGLAGIDTYTRLVDKWRDQGRLAQPQRTANREEEIHHEEQEGHVVGTVVGGEREAASSWAA